jgi:S-adenosylmethionine synthetase
LAYAIGVPDPVSVDVETFGTGRLADEEIARAVEEVFDFRPGSIIESLRLRDPIFKPTAVYGHFGRESREVSRDGGLEVRIFPWEALNRVEELRTAAKV